MKTVDFGYERVTPEEKTTRVRGVFDSVAGSYDLMNDLMSGGMHRLWKRFALVADRASGPGSARSTSPPAPATSARASRARSGATGSPC